MLVPPKVLPNNPLHIFYSSLPLYIYIYTYLGLVRIIKGNCLDKLCFYNYPVVKTKSDNNNNTRLYT